MPKLNDVKKGEVAAILAMGGSRQTAALYVSCHVNTIRKTAIRDPDFAAQLRQAESKYEILNLGHINAAAKDAKYWRAAAWALERLDPDRYGNRKPGTLTPTEISETLSQLAETVLDTIKDPAARLKIRRRINAMMRRLKDKAEGK